MVTKVRKEQLKRRDGRYGVPLMGIELDVLVGHPEHELLFVATQVARAAGLKNPSHAVANYHRCKADHTGLQPWDDIKKVYHLLPETDQSLAALKQIQETETSIGDAFQVLLKANKSSA